MAALMNKTEIAACNAAERKASFDRHKAESDLDDVMRSLGIGTGYGPSVVPGVAVYLCEDWIDEDRIRRELETRGHKIVDVRSTTWVGEDGTDEEAVAVAFDTPCLPAEWRDEVAAPKM